MTQQVGLTADAHLRKARRARHGRRAQPVLRWKGYRCYFYGGDESERPQVHVDHSGRTIEIWLETLKVACNDGYPLREVTSSRTSWIGTANACWRLAWPF